MRYEGFTASPLIEDKRPLQQRFQTLPMDGYLGATGGGLAQEMVNAMAQGLGSDLPAGPVTPSEYRPRGVGPERPPVQQMGMDDIDYRQGGPERPAGPQMLASLGPIPDAQAPFRQTEAPQGSSLAKTFDELLLERLNPPPDVRPQHIDPATGFGRWGSELPMDRLRR